MQSRVEIPIRSYSIMRLLGIHYQIRITGTTSNCSILIVFLIVSC